MRAAFRPETMFSDREESTGFQYAECLPKEQCAIRNVHSHVLGVRSVKHCLAIWQMFPLTKLDLP